MADPKDTREQKRNFKDTLNLPRTEFAIRPKIGSDMLILKRWQEEDLFAESYHANQGSERFILHDGPPYANGHLHLGHAYNNILKDIIGKYNRMMGKHVPIIPGWDCHGLPIELAVVKERRYESKEELKKACRAYAQHWIDVQKEELKKMGILMNWDDPYTTMSPKYEALILHAFKYFVQAGYIERKNKTVAWCPSCRTVLSSAEIEYQNRQDPSVYVLFPVKKEFVKALVPELAFERVSFLVWTTTPWTLPLNRAVLLKPQTRYAVVKARGNYIIVGHALLEKLTHIIGHYELIACIDSQIVGELGTQAEHPFIEDFSVPVILDASVVVDEGTACVHCAPGCGPQDYEVGVNNGLEIFSPITPDGKYARGIVPEKLLGMSYSDGQQWVMNELHERSMLFHKTEVNHSYPHCWRCHKPLIFRATKQWFCDLSRHNLRARALDAIDTLKMLPPASANRLTAAVEGRLEWCLSRQRVWGTPIPGLLCSTCDYTYSTPELIDQVANRVEKEGIEAWDTMTIAELLPHQFACPSCGGSDFVKEQDILDVWFESGLVQYVLPLLWPDEKLFPADIYVEGKDQHRGWFQSSLLNSMVLNGQAPMKAILTHGFTVDEHGRKMSKSIGNVVSPQQMVEKLGIDGLRLWVSSIDYTDDAVVSKQLMENVVQVNHKIRNTCRFLLSNLYDFDVQADARAWEQLHAIDQYALAEYQQVKERILHAYKTYNFTAIFHELAEYCAVNLSAFYLDIIKDRLYVEVSAGDKRRSAQTVCYYILDSLTRLIAPIMSFTAQELFDNYQKTSKRSIHLQPFTSKHEQQYAHAIKSDAETAQQLDALKKVRSAILKGIEVLREQGIIKHSLEARVTLNIDFDKKELMPLKVLCAAVVRSGQTVEEFFKEVLIVSQCTFAENINGLSQTELHGVYLLVQRAQGTKCPRCWQWQETKNEDGLCDRCQQVVGA